MAASVEPKLGPTSEEPAQGERTAARPPQPVRSDGAAEPVWRGPLCRGCLAVQALSPWHEDAVGTAVDLRHRLRSQDPGAHPRAPRLCPHPHALPGADQPFPTVQVPDEHFSTLLAYLAGLKGQARELTVQKAEALMRELDEAGAGSPDHPLLERTQRVRQVLQLLS